MKLTLEKEKNSVDKNGKNFNSLYREAIKSLENNKKYKPANNWLNLNCTQLGKLPSSLKVSGKIYR